MLHALRASAAQMLSGSGLAPPLRPGQLSPTDFVAAGEFLIAASSAGWRWQRADGVAPCSSLPTDKQFLAVELFCAPPPAAPAEGEAGGFALLSECSAAAASPAAPAASVAVSLCYDHYWRTPRLFLSSSAMAPAAVLERFVAADMGGATATLEAHPQNKALGLSISLHPCKHAECVAALMGGAQPQPLHMYLAFLLKICAVCFHTAPAHVHSPPLTPSLFCKLRSLPPLAPLHKLRSIPPRAFAVLPAGAWHRRLPVLA